MCLLNYIGEFHMNMRLVVDCIHSFWKYHLQFILLFIFNKTEHVHVGESNVLRAENLQVVASQILNIDNVTIDDNGNYFCEVIVNSLCINHAAYTLQVHSMYFKTCFNAPFVMPLIYDFTNLAPHDFHLSLSVQGGASEIIINSGTPKVEIIIEVSANPEPTLIW